jgi:CheY-like chemotaxis protein
VNTIKPLIDRKANFLTVKRPPVLGEIQTDMTKLRQMLLNLLSNSAKFTENGSICFEIKRQSEENGEWITFSVADNGIGMTEEQQKKIFQAFTQADASTTRRYGGTGLGLAITKQFADMMGGTISVDSEFGRGSILTISLPAQLSVKPQNQRPADSELQNMLPGHGIVVVVEDDALVRKMLKEELSQLGYAVAVAADGEEGLKLAYKLRPDVILIDVQMPNQEGWQLLATLKVNPLLSHSHLIMISMEENDEKWYVMGATDCLTKPVKREKLVSNLEKYHLSDYSQKLVMLVDDEDFLRQAMAAMLEVEGWRVVQAENGQVALEHLTNKKPSLILLDLNMPVMDGFEFLEKLQENQLWRAIPVIVLTAKQLNSEEQAHLNSYVQSIFQKESYDKSELVLQVHNIITKASEHAEKR